MKSRFVEVGEARATVRDRRRGQRQPGDRPCPQIIASRVRLAPKLTANSAARIFGIVYIDVVVFRILDDVLCNVAAD